LESRMPAHRSIGVFKKKQGIDPAPRNGARLPPSEQRLARLAGDRSCMATRRIFPSGLAHYLAQAHFASPWLRPGDRSCRSAAPYHGGGLAPGDQFLSDSLLGT
jgi:hypothetical protein